MSIIGWIILVLVAGFIGSKIVNKHGEGVMLDIALGIVGAIVGGILFSAFGAEGITGLNLWSMIVADDRGPDGLPRRDGRRSASPAVEPGECEPMMRLRRKPSEMLR